MIKLDRLLTWLNQSTLQTTNNPLYQVIKTLIRAAIEFQNEQTAVNESTTGSIENATFLTANDETATLPNSVQLVAGTGITFDDSVANQKTISSTGGAEWSVLTDGDLIEPELIFAGGDVIMTHIP